MAFTDEERAELRRAKTALENPSFLIKLFDIVGQPVEYVMKKLPKKAQVVIAKASDKALSTSLDVACWTLNQEMKPARNTLHKLAVMGSGAAGGAFGLPGLRNCVRSLCLPPLPPGEGWGEGGLSAVNVCKDAPTRRSALILAFSQGKKGPDTPLLTRFLRNTGWGIGGYDRRNAIARGVTVYCRQLSLATLAIPANLWVYVPVAAPSARGPRQRRRTD